MRPLLRVASPSLALALAVTLAGCAADGRPDWQAAGGVLQQIGGSAAGSATLDNSTIVAGLREALAQGTTRAINQLGRTDGFWKDASARIPLPEPLAGAEKTLRQFGQGAKLDAFQLTLNRAAESAVPQVADIFGNAVRQMSIADARAILQGQQNAATRYFERSATPALRARILPIVQNATASVGVTQSYKKLSGQIGPWLQLSGRSMPDLDGYVTDQALSALFAKIAIEEANIRANPAARGSELLKQVFGSR